MNSTDTELIPVSAVIATLDRADALKATLESLARESHQPAEIVVVDASEGASTKAICEGEIAGLGSSVRWVRATEAGAAKQRTEGVGLTNQNAVWFFDDDILFEPDCVARLWRGLQSDEKLGGVNAMIVNQRYLPPGLVSRAVFSIMNGGREKTFAGKVIGPAINLLPEDRDDLPSVVSVEWLNTTCTIYRREALPTPAFDPFFEGYSLMEDVALSLRVGQKWKLANVRDARIFHDSQPGEHKTGRRRLARMETVNRHYVVRNILDQRGLLPLLRMGLWQLFQLASVAARPSTRGDTVSILLGQADAVKAIILSARR